MLKSMTGFGRWESVSENYKISVEMKAVNHRYLDLNLKMPRKFNPFDAAIRNLLKKYIQRGKVDVFINYENYSEDKMNLSYNASLAKEYMACFSLMESQFGIENDIKVSDLSRYPEVLSMEQAADDEAELWDLLAAVIEEAAKKFVDARTMEGENLRIDINHKLEYILSLVSFIELRFPEILEEYRKRLEEKVKELLNGAALDENRILTEVTIFADKICVDEEMVRLRSHVDTMRSLLSKGGTIGRQLDFIVQEMNREANTALSKLNDKEMTEKAIALKTEIEKVREQIQNIE